MLKILESASSSSGGIPTMGRRSIRLSSSSYDQENTAPAGSVAASVQPVIASNVNSNVASALPLSVTMSATTTTLATLPIRINKTTASSLFQNTHNQFSPSGGGGLVGSTSTTNVVPVIAAATTKMNKIVSSKQMVLTSSFSSSSSHLVSNAQQQQLNKTVSATTTDDDGLVHEAKSVETTYENPSDIPKYGCHVPVESFDELDEVSII